MRGQTRSNSDIVAVSVVIAAHTPTTTGGIDVFVAIARVQYRSNRRFQRREDVPDLCGAGVQEGKGVAWTVWCAFALVCM